MLEYINIGDIKPYPKNNKKHSPRQIELVANSIRDFGFNQPVVIDGDNICIVGHARVEACKKLGINSIPCIKKTDLTPEQIKAYRIADNKLSDLGEYDLENIDAEIADLLEADFNLSEYGLDDLIPVEDVEVVEDEAPEPPVNPVSELGDIWLLGKHRVLCGDSTLESSYINLMQGKKADMVFTDPPYGISYQSNGRVKSVKFDVLQNDDVILTEWIPLADANSRGFVFIWSTWKVIKKWIDATECLGEMSNLVVWDKGGGGIGDLKKTFATDYEIALVWHRNTELTGKRLGSVWSVNKDGASTYAHPTQKPVELAHTAIKVTTNKYDGVLDVFLGSGSTLIACEQLDRICYGIELEPKYIDVIINRWQNLTGKEAIHEKTGKTYKELKDVKGI